MSKITWATVKTFQGTEGQLMYADGGLGRWVFIGTPGKSMPHCTSAVARMTAARRVHNASLASLRACFGREIASSK
jgi:hypothetical protein